MSPESTDPLEERTRLVSHALELRDSGKDDWLDLACGERPEWRTDIEEAVAKALSLPQVFIEGASRDGRVGTTLAGRYQLVRNLGSGAMGVVYEARDLELDRSLAIKVLRHGMMAEDRAEQRFEREAHAMAAIDHPAIIGIHDRGRTEDGESFIVMDLVDGIQLGSILEELSEDGVAPAAVDGMWVGQRLGNKAWSKRSYVRIIAAWGAELAAGLAAAHERGIVHRDVKPSNVMIRRDGRPLLLDFGLARAKDSPALTLEGSGIGTPAYMPPEALGANRNTSSAADIYGLCAVLYSLLGLRAPYAGSPAKVMFALASHEPAALSGLHVGLPTDLIAIVEKGMDRNVAGRYGTAQELERDLRAFLDHKPVVARPIGALRRAWRRSWRSKAFRGAGAVVVLFAVLWAAGQGRASYLAERASQWTELSRHFPPNFTILNPQNRKYLNDRDRDALATLLDRATACCNDPLPTYLLRASFRLDHDDVPGSIADMQHIAREEGTAFASALAFAYAQLDHEATPATKLDLSQLPDPVTNRDKFLRAYHHVRDFEDPEALALLTESVREELAYSEELRFAMTLLDHLPTVERRQKAIELLEDLVKLEQRTGVQTAATAHYKAYALANLRQYTNALEVARASVALAPRSHVNRTNAAFSAFALGQLKETHEHLEVAIELRPNDFKPAETRIWTYIAATDFDRALTAIDESAAQLDGVVSWWSPEFRGIVQTYRALSLESDGLARAEAIALAVTAFDEACAAGAARPAPFATAMLTALVEEHENRLFEALVDQAQEDPGMWRVKLVLKHFPTQLDIDSTQAVRALVDTLGSEMSAALVEPSTSQ